MDLDYQRLSHYVKSGRQRKTDTIRYHLYCSSVAKLCAVLQLHGLQHARLPCPSLSPASIFPSIRVFSNESALRIKWPKYWSCRFNISPSKEHPGLISFRIDWLDILSVQGTLMSLLQHHSSKVSILQCSVFFIIQLSHPYMITEKKP